MDGYGGYNEMYTMASFFGSTQNGTRVGGGARETLDFLISGKTLRDKENVIDFLDLR